MVLKAGFSSSEQHASEGDDQKGTVKRALPPGDSSTWGARSSGLSNSRKQSVGAAHPGSGPHGWGCWVYCQVVLQTLKLCEGSVLKCPFRLRGKDAPDSEQRLPSGNGRNPASGGPKEPDHLLKQGKRRTTWQEGFLTLAWGLSTLSLLTQDLAQGCGGAGSRNSNAILDLSSLKEFCHSGVSTLFLLSSIRFRFEGHLRVTGCDCFMLTRILGHGLREKVYCD